MLNSGGRGEQMTKTRMKHGRARLYQSIRTAHLERAHQLAPAAIIYRQRRYDFDADLARGLELIEAGPFKTARILAGSRLTALEVNEPLMLSSLPGTALALLSLSARRLLGGQRVLVVSYAIGNSDPYDERHSYTWKSSLRKVIERRLAGMVWNRVDRIVFGTAAARDTYYGLLPQSERRKEVLIHALPAACSCQHHQLSDSDPHRVIYLGDLSERKGFPLLLEAWPAVRDADPAARLTIVGKGALVDQAISSAAADCTIDVVIDPPRHEIHRQLCRAQVLVLPSQSTPIWREQVGLPIVEGLAHGCSIVTTTETGLASWLADHDHSVLAPCCSAGTLGEALLDQMDRATPRSDVIATLPHQDGRLAADAWLFETDSRVCGT